MADDLDVALQASGCERLREWVEIGPVQRAALEAFAEALSDLDAALAQQAEPTLSQQMADAGFARRPSLWSLQAREALELIAAPQRPDGTWNRDREACRQIAAEALGRYEDD